MCGTGYEPEECLFSKKSSRLVHSSSLACEFGARRLLAAAVFLFVVVRRAELTRNAANPLEPRRFVHLSLEFETKENKQFKHKDRHELTSISARFFIDSFFVTFDVLKMLSRVRNDTSMNCNKTGGILEKYN